MTFESEDAYKNWLKINGYDKADIDIMSSNWETANTNTETDLNINKEIISEISEN